eukprot:CAMPEP_0184863658 /NCGR_PEP_ID=MMETSP0580-20130426/12087_1 /TAXON_ID=1118495 /ORGANISM="Dactyliosolen fragilissimus" /LENGTH=246 /DNA_ID=CAMNT_0027362113 /DNA_START=131 /DNA_END=871 /DNA_ORIENTATION=-
MVASGMSSPTSLIKLKGEQTDKAVSCKTCFVDIIALCAVTIGALAVFAYDLNVIADIMGFSVVFFGPFAALQKRQIMDLGGLRTQINILMGKVDELAGQNRQLETSVNQLNVSTNRLDEIRHDLSKLANTDNVDRLMEVVKETKRINGEIKENLESRIIQDILTTVMRTDRNSDLMIGPKEKRALMFRLDQMTGVDFNADRFETLMGDEEYVRIGKIMSVIRNLLDGDALDSENNVFVLHPEQLKQ